MNMDIFKYTPTTWNERSKKRWKERDLHERNLAAQEADRKARNRHRIFDMEMRIQREERVKQIMDSGSSPGFISMCSDGGLVVLAQRANDELLALELHTPENLLQTDIRDFGPLRRSAPPPIITLSDDESEKENCRVAED